MRTDLLYNIIRAPVLTEKSMRAEQEYNQHVFRVRRDANKAQIKEAVERIYGVEVLGVRVVVTKGKRKRNRYGGWSQTRPTEKKAYVRIARQQAINPMEIGDLS